MLISFRRLLRATVLALLIVAVVLVVGAPAAQAADGTVPAVSFDVNVPLVLNVLIATVFPLLVGVVTKATSSGRLKAILLATISLASGIASQLLAALTAGATFDLFAALITGLAAWLIAIGIYEGFWKPTGAAAVVNENVGVGTVSRVDGAHNVED